jgi:drug/metabolite transporter (DMT)-like permease
VVIPFLASWVVWSEEPSAWQLAGMGLASVAFFLIAQKEKESQPEPALAAVGEDASDSGDLPDRSSEGEPGANEHLAESEAAASLPEPNARVLGTLFILFLSGGAVDITMKTFQESFGADNSRFLFLLLAFGIAFLIGLAIVLVRGVRYGAWPDRKTVLWGTILGVINYGSLEFLLRALELLPGTVVFPVNNIAIVILAAILGVTVWKERLSRTNQIGLAFAVAGLILLNV